MIVGRVALALALAGPAAGYGAPAGGVPAAPAAGAPHPATGAAPTGAAPAGLGADLSAIGAFDDGGLAVDPRLVPPPPADTLWPRALIGSGAALVAIGALGMLISPGCATRDRAARCLDPRGSHPAWPALIVVGLGSTVTGSYWYRRLRLGPNRMP